VYKQKSQTEISIGPTCVADDNIDVTLATQSSTALTTGKIRVWAVLMDCTDQGSDMTAQEVDRDTLA